MSNRPIRPFPVLPPRCRPSAGRTAEADGPATLHHRVVRQFRSLLAERGRVGWEVALHSGSGLARPDDLRAFAAARPPFTESALDIATGAEVPVLHCFDSDREELSPSHALYLLDAGALLL